MHVRRYLPSTAPRYHMVMMRMNMRILVLVMCLCTTWCFGMLSPEGSDVTGGGIEVKIDDSSVHEGAASTDIAMVMPRISMGAATDGTLDISNYDDVAVTDSAAVDSAQEKRSSLDARMVRVKGREVSCVDNG